MWPAEKQVAWIVQYRGAPNEDDVLPPGGTQEDPLPPGGTQEDPPAHDDLKEEDSDITQSDKLPEEESELPDLAASSVAPPSAPSSAPSSAAFAAPPGAGWQKKRRLQSVQPQQCEKSSYCTNRPNHPGRCKSTKRPMFCDKSPGCMLRFGHHGDCIVDDDEF